MTLSAFPYPGGKTVYCREILRYFPAHRRYVEPFGGSAAVLLNKPPSYIEVYNDLDDDVVHFFRVLRERREELVAWLRRVPYSRSVYDEWVTAFFDGHRPDDDIDRAGRWFYLRFSQFNGVLDRRNGFKTGGKRNEARSFRGSIDDLDAVAERFAEVTIECEPYAAVLDRYDHPDTLFYLDPPYYGADRSHYRVGRDFDHAALVDALRDREGYWLVSSDELPPGLADVATTVETYIARYSMAYSDERPEHVEYLAMNFDPAAEPSFTAAEQRRLGDSFGMADGGDP